MTRYDDLPPVDVEGYQADQGRYFLQQTDRRISRLGLPDFFSNTQKKIQGLGSDLSTIYGGLERGLSSLPSAAQQASTDFLSSTTDRISGLGAVGEGIGSRVGEVGAGLQEGVGGFFSDIGTGLRSSLEAQGALERTTAETTERERGQRLPPGLAGQEVGPPGFRTVIPEAGTEEGERVLTELARTATERTPGGRLFTDAARQTIGKIAPMTADTPVENVAGLGQTALTAWSPVGALAEAGARGAVERLPGGETSALETLTGGRITRETPFLGGLTTPDELVPFMAGAAGLSGPIDEVAEAFLGVLARGGKAVTRPLVERFLREMGPNTLRTAVSRGEDALGALFDDFTARLAQSPAGRLATEEEGGLRLPRLSRQITPEPEPGAPPTPAAPQTPGVQRALADRVTVGQANAASAATPGVPAPLPPGSLLKTFDDPVSKLQEQWTDAHARVRAVVKEYERRTGKKLSARDNLYVQMRLFAGRSPAADARIEDALESLAKSVSPSEFERAEALAVMLDNADKARAIQNRVTAEVAGTPVGPVAGETALRNTEQSLRMRRVSLGRALQAQQDADDAYRAARTELSRVRREGRREVQGSQGRGRRRLQRSPEEQARIEAEAQGRVDAARQATVDARAAAKQAARDANVNLSKVTRADLSRMRQEAEVEARRLAEEGEIAEGAAGQGAQAAASRRFSGGVSGDHAVEDILEAERIETGRQLAKELGRPATADEVEAAFQKSRTVAEQLAGYFRELRHRLGDEGIFPQELVERWDRDFPHYIRTNILRELEQEAATPAAAGAQRFTVNSLTTGGVNLGARLTEEGTDALREQPLNAAIRMTHATEAIIRRNRGAKALERMIQGDPDGPTGSLAKEFRPLKEGESPKAGEVVFSVRDAGDVRRYAVDQRFEPMFSLEPQAVLPWLQALGKWTGKEVFEAGATRYSLPFQVVNGMRDALVYLRREPRSAREVPGAVAELVRSYRDLGRTGGRGTPRWREALAAGAGQDSAYAGLSPQQARNRMLLDPQQARRARQVTTPGAARRALDVALTGRYSPIGATGRGVGAVGRGIRATGAAIETAPRQAAYTRARARGLSEDEAALAARDVTMDFSRGGTLARQANAALPFFNAAIQGAARFYGDDLVNRKKATAAQAIGLLGLKLGLDAYNRNYGAEYDDIPNYQKDSGLIFMLPGDVRSETREDGTPAPGQRPYLYFPLPQDMATVLKAGSAVLRRAAGEETYGFDTPRGVGEGALDVLGAFLPVPLEIESVLPPAARQLVEQGANYDFFRGRQVVPEYLEARPAAEQATDRTSALGRVVGGVTGQLSPLGPERIDHLVRGMLGGTGRQLLRGSDAAARLVGRGDLASRPYSEPEGPDLLGAAQGVPLVGDTLGALLRQGGGQLDETGRARLAGEAERRKAEIRRELEQSPGWFDLPAAEREGILDDLYRSIDEELRTRGTEEREVRMIERAQAQGA